MQLFIDGVVIQIEVSRPVAEEIRHLKGNRNWRTFLLQTFDQLYNSKLEELQKETGIRRTEA